MENGTNIQITHLSITRCVCILAFVLLFTCAFAPAEVRATDSITISRGEQFQLSAMLLTNGTFGEPLANQVVEFFDQTYDQYIGDAITDDEGIATISYQFSLSHPKGNTLLNATYRGNVSLALAPSCQYIPLVITSTTSMDLSTSSYEYAPNDVIEVFINLRDDTNNPLPNATLDIYCDGKHFTNTNTNNEGNSSIFIDISSNDLRLGTHIIEVIYSGDLVNYQRGVRDELIIDIRQIPSFLSSKIPIPETFSLNHTLPLEFEASSNEDVISNASISIYVDEISLGMTLTNESGLASFEIRFNESFSLGWHNLIIQYQGDTIFASFQLSYTIFLQSDLIIEIDCDTHAVINSSTVLSVSICDIFYRTIPAAYVNMTDSLTHYSDSISTSNSKNASFEFLTTGPIGNRTVLILVSSIYSTAPVSIPLTLGVWTSPTIDVISSDIDGFASPNQHIQFALHLSDQLGNLSEREIGYSILGTNETGVMTTNQEGMVSIMMDAPSAEQVYELLFYFNGSRYLFELPISCTIVFTVSSRIPIQVQDFVYAVDHLRKLVSVDMSMKASNGTVIEGIIVELTWLENDFSVVSGNHGRIHLEMIIPNSPGLFSLEYRIIEMVGIRSTSDSLHILISPIDSNVSEGLGFLPLVFGVTISFSIPALPLLKKRSMLE